MWFWHLFLNVTGWALGIIIGLAILLSFLEWLVHLFDKKE